MAIETQKGLRVNYLMIFIGGLMFLCASILTFLLIIKNIYGDYELAQIMPNWSKLWGGIKNYEINIESDNQIAAILYSKYTENMNSSTKDWVQKNIADWEKKLKEAKFKYDVINDEKLEKGDLSKYNLIILPGVKSMIDLQLVQLKKYIENGGSIFATGGISTWSDESKWRGWDFFTEVFGMKFTRDLIFEDMKKVKHTIRGDLPITAGIPAGYALNIATWDSPVSAEILDPRTTQASYWFNFQNELGLVQEEIKKSAGISFGNYGKGRFVWFGFELTSVVEPNFYTDDEYWANFDRLFQNCLNWLTYKPTSFIKFWPAEYTGAVIFVPTVDKNINNLNNLVSIAKRHGIQPTIFIDPDVAKQNPSLMKQAAKYAEFAAIVDVGRMNSVFDTTNKLFSKEIQFKNVSSAKSALEKIIGTQITGISPKYGYFDVNTKSAVIDAGLSFILTDSLTDRAVPKYEIWDDMPLLTFTKTARDDHKIIKEYGLTEPKFQRYTYFEDVDRVAFQAGLYVLKVHTDYQLDSSYAGVISEVFNYAKEKKLWLTSIAELKKWWYSKGTVRYRYESVSNRRLAIEVTNRISSVMNNYVAEIHLNKPIKDIKISSDIIFTELPKYYYDSKKQVLYLYVNDLKLGETRSIIVDYDNVPLFSNK